MTTTTELTDKDLARYYRNEPTATQEVVKMFLKECGDEVKGKGNPTDSIVYGTHALNAYMPSWLDRETKDWDILIKEDPEKAAKELERLLDKRYRGDFFSVTPAKHPGTFKIRSRVTGDEVADLTLNERTDEYNRIRGIAYVPLSVIEEDAKRILEDPDYGFRHKKDRDTLQRIKLYRLYKKRTNKRNEKEKRTKNSAILSPHDK